jgi:hypothetical protein
MENIYKIKSLFNPTSVVLKIYAHLEKSTNKKQTPKKPSNKPSTLSSKCIRKSYYSYFRESEKISIESLLTFKAGHKAEEAVIEYLKEIGGILIDPRNGKGQFEVSSPRWRVDKGFIDAILILDKKFYLIDIKSTNSNKFKSLGEIASAYKEQIAQYYQMFNDLLKIGHYSDVPALVECKGIEAAGILYVCKDTYQMKEFWLSKPELNSIVLKFDKKVMSLIAHIDKEVLPPPTPDFCNWCPFQEKCKKNENIKKNS